MSKNRLVSGRIAYRVFKPLLNLWNLRVSLVFISLCLTSKADPQKFCLPRSGLEGSTQSSCNRYFPTPGNTKGSTVHTYFRVNTTFISDVDKYSLPQISLTAIALREPAPKKYNCGHPHKTEARLEPHCPRPQTRHLQKSRCDCSHLGRLCCQF